MTEFHERPSAPAAIILARGGSKGVPGKNLRPVGGVSLLARSVRAARSAAGVGSVWVSTDDARIAAEVRREGARVVDRPADISGDTASSEAGWLHALATMRAQGFAPDTLVLLQCTSPFTSGADIDACLAARARRGAACALSVVADHSFLWREDETGYGRGINHVETEQRKRRQDLPPAFRENGAIYVVDAGRFEAVGRRFCGTVALCPVDHPPLEIDSLEDLEIADAIARSREGMPGAPSPARLAAIRAVVMDFDGVHTDDLVTVDQDGREMVTASRRDGLGLEALRRLGRHRLVIVSKERNPVVLARAAKLGIEVMASIEDKVSAVEAWLAGQGLGWDDAVFVGNDRNDVPAMRCAGLSAAPADAHAEALAVADWVLPHPGGRGALRALCDALCAIEEPASPVGAPLQAHTAR